MQMYVYVYACICIFICIYADAFGYNIFQSFPTFPKPSQLGLECSQLCCQLPPTPTSPPPPPTHPPPYMRNTRNIHLNIHIQIYGSIVTYSCLFWVGRTLHEACASPVDLFNEYSYAASLLICSISIFLAHADLSIIFYFCWGSWSFGYFDYVFMLLISCISRFLFNFVDSSCLSAGIRMSAARSCWHDLYCYVVAK